MRLLFVVNYAEFFLSHRAVLAVAARQRGYDVHVAAQDGPLVPRVRALGLPFHVLPRMRGTTRPHREVQTVAAMHRLYRRLRPAIVHHVSIKPVIYGGIAAQLAGVPAVVSAISGLGSVFVASGAWGMARRAAVVVSYRAALRHRNARVIVQNEDDRSFVHRLGETRTSLIAGSGVDLSAFAPTPERTGEAVVVLPARLLRDKGVVEFVEAARMCRRAGSSARFALVGPLDPDNPSAVSEGELRRWVSEKAVEWWGQRDDMPEVYRQAHLVALPSYREGLSKTLIEASASARPIVTTDVPGCRDVVKQGQSGLLVPARDAESLAQAMLSLLRDPALREKMGSAGRERAVREFGVESVIAQTLDVYESLLDRSPRTPLVDRGPISSPST
jgi:glycosyltransferase involved in cell wall biosynthesis